MKPFEEAISMNPLPWMMPSMKLSVDDAIHDAIHEAYRMKPSMMVNMEWWDTNSSDGI
jgi:hypothetical protein